MLDAFYVDGVTILNTKRQITNINGLSSAEIDVASYARGGRSGVALSTPYYRGLAFSIEFVILGSDFDDYVDQRDAFIKLFRLEVDKSLEQKRTLQFDLADGSVRKINVIVKEPKGDLKAENKKHGYITIPFLSEREYLQGVDKTETVYIFNGGGMAIPMPIPMDMSNSTGAQTKTLTNNGNTDSFPTVRVYGTMASFDLVNQTTGKTISCSENLATDNDYIDFDFYNRTAVKNGTTNVLDQISGDWWWLQPGDNVVKMVTAGSDPDAQAQFTYQDAFIGL